MSSAIRVRGGGCQWRPFKHSFMVPAGLLAFVAAAAAQGINYPVGNPTATSGAGNARTDPDNFFLRNNIAGITEIPSRDEEEKGGKLGAAPRNQWHFHGDFQIATCHFPRDCTVAGVGAGLGSEATIGFPGAASEVLYVAGDHRYALGA